MKGMGVNKEKVVMKKSTRRRKKRMNLVNNIRGIITYLGTDSYLYSHLINSPPPLLLHKSSGFEKNEGLLRKTEEGELLKDKLNKYLKYDAYLYAPLGDHVTLPHPDADRVFVKKVVSSPTAQDLEFTGTRVTRTTLSKKIALQNREGPGEILGGDKRGNVGVTSLPTPQIPQARKQGTPPVGYADSVRMKSSVMRELRSR